VSRLRFGPFEADPASGELLRDGQRVPLQDLPFRLLVALLERPGEVVTRVELAERLWGKGTHVDAAAGLHTAVAKLREALGDTAEAPRLVETLPRRGYRFLGSALRAGGEAGAAGAEAGAAGAEEREAPSLAAAGEAGRSAARGRPRGAAIALVALVALALALAAGWWAATRPAEHRVAVILFDDETGLPGGARRAQALTDATVERLTREADLAVIGNAAVLRTARPFRDLLAIRDALDADLLVVGQLQQLDGGTVVRAHLIRGDDQAHVWFATIPFRDAGEAAFQREVADHIAAAVRTEVDG
jgi:DNA-binding winged helix-turn-helix (wHTH) protein/TolB-like protein